MPLDAVCLTALINELALEITGARIDKVQQPERDLLLLSLHTAAGGNRRLLLSAASGGARLHLTETRMENPESPPMFCMLLRKHLSGARILSVTQPPFERLAVLTLRTRDELGEETEKRLVCELMGRSANILLVDAEDIIIDCLRRADFGEDAQRRLLPGMRYRLPPKQTRPCFYETAPGARRALWAGETGEEPADRWLMRTFSGLCPLAARELAFRAGCRENLPEAMDALGETVARGELAPYLLMEDGAPTDFFFMPVNQYGPAVQAQRQESFSALLDTFYAQRDRKAQMRRISADTVKAVRTRRDRQARKLVQQRQELAATADRDAVRKRADLITANLWRLGKGDRVLRCEDYFEEGAPETEIPLDPLKTPQQNAAALYKEYRKAAAAEAHLTGLIAEGERQLDYLESVLDELGRAESEKDVADIRLELAETGVLRRSRGGKPRKLRPRGPMRFVSSDGFEILVGRSNAQNDELTLRTARRTDLWLHTKSAHGSHVILRTGGGTPGDAALAEAASLAAYFSQARESGKTQVDCTQVRFVKKPAGALPGMVVYTDHKTLWAAPDAALAARLRAE